MLEEGNPPEPTLFHNSFNNNTPVGTSFTTPRTTASPRTLFRVEASVPLRKHMAILDKQEPALTVIRLQKSDSDSTAESRFVLSPLPCSALGTHTMPENTVGKDSSAPEPSPSSTAKEDTPQDSLDEQKDTDPTTATWSNQSSNLESRASSVSTVASSNTPSLAQPDDAQLVVIDLDADDDDNDHLYRMVDERALEKHIADMDELEPPESVLGKRKLTITADADIDGNHDADVACLSTKIPRTSTSDTTASGSQHYPVELDSDSDTDGHSAMDGPRVIANNASGNAGSTINEPIVIATENSTIDDKNAALTAGSVRIGESEKMHEVGMKTASGVSAPISDTSGSLQDQLKSYQQLQRERFEQRSVRSTSNSNVAAQFSRSSSSSSIGSSSQPKPESTQRTQATTPFDTESKVQVQELVHVSSAPLWHADVENPWAIDTVGTMDGHYSESTQAPKPDNITAEGLVLSQGQMYVIDQIVNHHRNVFFTGSAGTGKSVLLRELIRRLKRRYSRWSSSSDWDSLATGKVAVTASTGIAACNIGGCTLHSFAGIGLGQEPLETLVSKVYGNRLVTRRWRSTSVLIVDEISMIDAVLLDKLEGLARRIRNNEQPWGGIQVVLCGDFFQLPPVDKTGMGKFCFEAHSWTTSIQTTVQLERIFRQQDQTFADMLNQMRIGRMSAATIECFRSLTREIVLTDGIKPTELFPLRKQVEESNMAMLRKLTGESLIFVARDSGKMKDRMEQHCIAPTTLEIKVNSQVMLLRNQGGGTGGLVNGSIGTVIAFVKEPAHNHPVGPEGESLPSLNTPGELLPKVRFANERMGVREMVVGREAWTMEMPDGEVLGRRVQIPLCLAWALSIHKSQGQTLPMVRVDLGRVFEKGQAYVALSRATTLEGLQVLNFDPHKVMVHPKVVDFYEQVDEEMERVRAEQSSTSTSTGSFFV